MPSYILVEDAVPWVAEDLFSWFLVPVDDGRPPADVESSSTAKKPSGSQGKDPGEGGSY